jgi:LysR family glycine cleavage system transcriptional activator
MKRLRQQLPPLDTLVAFESAARLLSFTAAARELSISQAAVSQQIRKLEQRLQAQLFLRRHRAVELTPAGRQYQHTVAMALAHLADASTEARGLGSGARLTIAADQSAAALWLVPRLGGLLKRLPDIAFRIVVSDDESQCLGEDVQASILHGDGTWPGFESERIFPEEVFPVCSPGYLAANPQIATPEGLAAALLLDLEDEHWNWITWRIWLTELGIGGPAAHRPLSISSYPLVIEAARAGQGVALGWRHLVDDDLQIGRLVQPLNRWVTTSFGYHLAWPLRAKPLPEALAFCDWVREETSRQRLHRPR